MLLTGDVVVSLAVNMEIVGALVKNGANLELGQKSYGGGGERYFTMLLTAPVLIVNVAVVELLEDAGGAYAEAK